jgi:DNA-directed RNA polymerase subunit N (RpoN/RPB10)
MEKLITVPLPWMFCPSCAKNIGDIDQRAKYKELIEQGKRADEAFEEIGLERDCCRGHFTNMPVIPTCRPRLMKFKSGESEITTKRLNSSSLPGSVNAINEEVISVKTQLLKNTSLFEKIVPSIEIVKSSRMRSKK